MQTNVSKADQENMMSPNPPRIEELPRSWTQPRRQKLGVQDNFMASFPDSALLGVMARRDVKDSVVADDVHLTFNVPKDSRRKAKVRAEDDSARLMFSTCQLMSANQILSKAQEDAENAADATGRPLGPLAEYMELTEEEIEKEKAERQSLDCIAGWRAPVSGKDGENLAINPAVIMRLDKVRAIFRGHAERKQMAILQMEHIAAEKIQLCWLESRRRKNSAATIIQNAYRSQLFRDILRGMEQAKELLRNEDIAITQGGQPIGTTRGGLRVPSSSNTTLVFPWGGNKFESSDVGKLVRKIIAAYLGLPLDLDHTLVKVLSVDANATAASVSIPLSLPVRVRPQVEDMQRVVDADRTDGTRNSPLAPVIDALGGWSVGPIKNTAGVEGRAQKSMAVGKKTRTKQKEPQAPPQQQSPSPSKAEPSPSKTPPPAKAGKLPR
jgi:hypothetical protein